MYVSRLPFRCSVSMKQHFLQKKSKKYKPSYLFLRRYWDFFIIIYFGISNFCKPQPLNFCWKGEGWGGGWWGVGIGGRQVITLNWRVCKWSPPPGRRGVGEQSPSPYLPQGGDSPPPPHPRLPHSIYQSSLQADFHILNLRGKLYSTLNQNIQLVSII